MSSKTLVIVESPAKASTIEKFLGKGYKVVSSFGHIRDLPKSKMGIEIDKSYQPQYLVTKDKRKVVTDLKAAAKKADEVLLASDEDREGEAIAWHVTEVLGLDSSKTKRIVFHEITEPAIKKAIAKPRVINPDLVDAQQARRVLDRLVGYELSPLLWRKVKRGLSAGRVQSVTVRLIAEREAEIKKFEKQHYYAVTAILSYGDGEIEAKLEKNLEKLKDLKPFLESLAKTKLKISDIETTPSTRSAPPPFTTSLLQQAAASQLSMSVKQTMMLAQRLYEAGHITYMRTDSMHLSNTAKNQAAAYIKKEYSEKYLGKGNFRKAAKGAQEAHEAIRPTNLAISRAGQDERQKNLYEMIRRRTIASQMAPAQVEKTQVFVNVSDDKRLVATGLQIKFPGFLAIEKRGTKENLLPKLKVGQELSLVSAEGMEKLKKHPMRYSEASLVRALEKLGIGRPSTYAPTISTVQDRGYVEKRDVEGESVQLVRMTVEPGQPVTEEKVEEFHGSDRNKLVPTDMGLLVNGFLNDYFKQIVDYDFTATVEKQFDHVAKGDLEWEKMIDDFYKPFHKHLQKIDKSVSKEDTGSVRKLGKDPESGKPIYARLGRFGPVIQLGEASQDDDDKPKFAPFPQGRTVEDVSLEEALTMLALPRVVGKFGKDEIETTIGRFGPYIRAGKQYVSVEYDDVFNITEEKAIELLKEGKAAKQKSLIKTFKGTKIQVKTGRFGPYVTDGKINASISKKLDPEKIDLEKAKELLEKKAARTKKK